MAGLFLTCLSISSVFAQSSFETENTDSLETYDQPDSTKTIKKEKFVISDTVKNHFGANPLNWENKRAYPRTATLLSLVPGGGQIYNFKFFKAPIVAFVNYWTFTKYLDARHDYRELKKKNDLVLQNNLDYIFYFKRLNNTSVVIDSAGLPPVVIDARGTRNLHFFGFAFTYILNIMDARMDALTANREKHSPVKAAYYSALVPGLGQAYNNKYWKIPLVYGVGSFFLFRYNRINSIYRYTNSRYVEAITSDDDNSLRDQETLKSELDQLSIDKERQIINLFLIYVMNIVDATVDAHFTGFSVDDDINVSMTPQFNPGLRTTGFQVTLHL